MLCFKKSALTSILIGTTLHGCSETTLAPCPVIINPLNTGQQVKLIVNQKVNEYAIALICSTNSPVIVGGSKRCLSQAEDGPYLSALFQTCSGNAKNAGGSTVLPTGKGQIRPPIVGSTNLPPMSYQTFSSSASASSGSFQSQPSTASAVPTASTSNPSQSSIHSSQPITTTTTPEPTTLGTEPTAPPRGPSGGRVSFDTTESPTSEPTTESAMSFDPTEPSTESTGFFDFAGGFF